jgi:hypothetical protein
MSLMLSMDLVLVEWIDVISDIIDIPSAVEAVFMDSWHVFCLDIMNWDEYLQTP